MWTSWTRCGGNTTVNPSLPNGREAGLSIPKKHIANRPACAHLRERHREHSSKAWRDWQGNRQRGAMSNRTENLRRLFASVFPGLSESLQPWRLRSHSLSRTRDYRGRLRTTMLSSGDALRSLCPSDQEGGTRQNESRSQRTRAATIWHMHCLSCASIIHHSNRKKEQ
jgi:hypothetical protein